MRFKETADDLAVKAKLWDATDREIERFARSYADGFVKGERYSDAQKDACAAAKRKGYPKMLIHALGAQVLKGEWGGAGCLNTPLQLPPQDRALNR
ncbi:hypothetical protein [Paracoccus shanxieyensis]|uniref:Uncharacterized protein n=1 Tax=Paracoccus shanxieyensis TaxID=2675752 RepID=A0A6L6J649_9RHOB|nr:hypothetical protein [Paracoccus shanxieyensis]MTH66720.1 hypothetical protein [Paracoccus shanxieyensis]MTH89955.1 hypothetical protein [Paracoccus shanxieyensis]